MKISVLSPLHRILLISIFLFLFSVLLVACQSPMRDTSTVRASPTTQKTVVKSATPAYTKTPAPFPTLTHTPATHAILQVDPALLSGIQVEFWHPWSGELAQEMDHIVGEFNSTNLWGIQVHTRSTGGNGALVDLVEENLESGVLPNLLAAPSEQILLWQEKHREFVNLNVYIGDKQWGLTEAEKADIPQKYWQQGAYLYQQPGLPALRNMRLLFYNQTWAEELGFFYTPQTVQEFINQSCAAADERLNIDETGGWIVDTHPNTVLSWLISSGLHGYVGQKNGEYRFNQQEAITIFTRLRQMLDDGCAWNSRNPEPFEYFARRQTILYSGSLSDILAQSEWMNKAHNPDTWAVIPFPSEKGKPIVLTYGTSYAILQTSPAKQLAAWLFLRWLILPRHQAQMVAVSGYLPVSASAMEELQDFLHTYPQWAQSTAWIPISDSTPDLGSWSMVQYILEDAAWQTFQSFTKTENIPSILEQLDVIIPEVLKMH